MRKSRMDKAKARPHRPGWKKKVRREATAPPDVVSRLRWAGRPTGDDTYRIVGMTLELVWYPNEKDCQAEENECLVSLLSIDSCEESPVTDPSVNSACERPATRCDCSATLVEQVDPQSLYGKWLRQQSHLGQQPIAAKTELITPLKLSLACGRPTRAAIRTLSKRGVTLVPNRDNVLDIRIIDPTPKDLSSLQVDRLTDLFEELGAYIPLAPQILRERERKLAQLRRAERAVRAKLMKIEHLRVDGPGSSNSNRNNEQVDSAHPPRARNHSRELDKLIAKIDRLV